MEKSKNKQESGQPFYMKPAITVITSNMKWHIRLWYVITNPFYYVFAGKWRL